MKSTTTLNRFAHPCTVIGVLSDVWSGEFINTLSIDVLSSVLAGVDTLAEMDIIAVALAVISA